MESAEELFDRHIPFAMHLAKRKVGSTPQQVGLDELFCAALEGLWMASRRFDASLGFLFTTYASKLVLGAMQDYLRSLDRYPRWFPEDQKRDHFSLAYPRDGNVREVSDSTFDPVEWAMAREENEILVTLLLRERDPRCKHARNVEILRRYAVDGEPQESLAEEYGITVPRVSQICTKERQRLGDLLAKKGVVPR